MFKNRQWRVTEFGIESIAGVELPTMKGVTPVYEFETRRLLETISTPEGELYDWPIHMADKTWVDINEFIEAFTAALRIHKGRYAGEVDAERLKKSFRLARLAGAKTQR